MRTFTKLGFLLSVGGGCFVALTGCAKTAAAQEKSIGPLGREEITLTVYADREKLVEKHSTLFATSVALCSVSVARRNQNGWVEKDGSSHVTRTPILRVEPAGKAADTPRGLR